MRYEVVIFDWAGTTVDYGCFSPVQAFVEAFEGRGITPTLDEVRKPMGMLKIDHVRTMLHMERISQAWRDTHGRDWTEDDVQEIYEISEKKILELIPKYSQVKPYVVDTIAKLRDMGVKIGSTTGYTASMMELVLPRAAAEGYSPDSMMTPDDVGGFGRPYPYMVFRNLEALKIDSVHKALKVGDTVSDIREGQHAGLDTVGIIEGSSLMGLTQAEYEALSDPEREAADAKVKATYEEIGATYIVRDIREVADIVAGS
ncbi:phosphonoacetaldehyde hydrolase [Trueperella bialowiezensis]|uniref:Phosphonoacetaldehyde hydrolase n=1 Tax=Trueperella bialowiezensis TaxID=312285 RepID=A0A3S4YYG7_9ACTO|nr:phosphonoacetaldehyde hydrolase [Trueperella bialowiezensis]VEI13599.1 Phosphonoacetaldehyde hydrolase [Trueperella bialowiezensis]